MESLVFEMYNREKNNRVKLEALILSFYIKLKNDELDIYEMAKEFKDHFDIEEKENGEISYE